ncbi:MAG: IclR family transcriptional regulator [Desulfobacterales bacterium]|nr:IclR family transcriptional regulator [Desulfobacterales bacterium]
MTEKKKNEGRTIQSVDRAMRAVMLFLGDVQELGITDFARRLGLAKPTVYSLINTLTKHQILEQNPENSKYRLGPGAFRLGLQYARHSDVLSTVSVWAERLCYKFGKSVNVCMLVGEQAVVVYKVDPDQVVISYPDVGAVVPLHSTANGKMLLAHADPEVRDSLLADYPFTRITASTITDRRQFEDELERTRSEGVSFNRQESVSGINAVAGPIFNHLGQMVASFAISGKTEEFNDNEGQLIAEVKKTAQSISKQMGYGGRIYF